MNPSPSKIPWDTAACMSTLMSHPNRSCGQGGLQRCEVVTSYSPATTRVHVFCYNDSLCALSHCICQLFGCCNTNFGGGLSACSASQNACRESCKEGHGSDFVMRCMPPVLIFTASFFAITRWLSVQKAFQAESNTPLAIRILHA